MVALAPNTSETSSWDVLDGFPKLHSRARDLKTRICTEAPHSKSLSRVEIWLMISESCVGLESFTRDPIGMHDGASVYQIYFWLHGLDPTGLSKLGDCSTEEDSFEISLFSKAERDRLNGKADGIPGVDGLTDFFAAIRKRVPLPQIDVKIKVGWKTKSCLEECECDRTAMRLFHQYKVSGKFSLKGARFPVPGLPPGVWFEFGGDMSLDVSSETETGGCDNVDKRQFCFNVGIKFTGALCGGVPGVMQGCVKFSADCKAGGCGAATGGPKNNSGCKWSVSTQGCLGPLCRETELAGGSIL